MDLTISMLALIILSPIFVITACILRFSGEGEIFFIQQRIGKDKKIIKLFKFATMLKNSPNIGTKTITLKDDPRVLPVGKFLRKSKLNELPQLINVVRGDMSLIGPRPQTEECFNAFPDELKPVITSVRPGLSGIGSIFFRNEEQMINQNIDPSFYQKIIMPYKGKLEEWFVKNQSIKLYFYAILCTVIIIFTKNNKTATMLFPNLPQPPLELREFF